MGNDLYWDVLQIPKEKRPPTYYDLLGLPFGEDDPALIDTAVQKQIKRIKLCQSGPYADQCPRLVKELAAAKATLIDPKKRADYIAILPNAEPVKPGMGRPASSKPSMPKPVASPTPAKKPVEKVDHSAFAVGPPVPIRPVKKSGSKMLLFAAAAMVVLLAVGVWIIVAVVQNSAKPKENGQPVVAHATHPATTQPDPVPPLPPVKPVDPLVAHADSDPREDLPVLDDPGAMAEKPIEPRTFKRHTLTVTSIALAPNGRRFLTGGLDKKLIDWKIDGPTGFQRHVFKVGVAAVAYSPNGQQAACCDEEQICLFDLSQNKILASRNYPRGNAQCLAFDPDGMHVLIGGSDGSMHWWNLATDEKPEKSIDIGTDNAVMALALSPDGGRVVAGLSDGSLGVWELASKRKLWHGIGHQDKDKAKAATGVTAVAFAPDGKHVASAGLDKTAKFWNAEAQAPSLKRFAHDSAVLSLAFASNGTQIITGCKDSTLRIWDIETGSSIRTLPAGSPVQCIAVQRESKFLIAGGPGGNLQLINLKDALSDPSLRDTPPDMKYALPDAAAVEVATLKVRNEHRALFDSDKPEEREVLLDKLKVRAAGKENQSIRYILFREAHDVAAKLGKISDAFKVIDEMDKWFQIDVLTDKATILTLAAEQAPAAAQKGVIDEAMKMLALADKDNRPLIAKTALQAMTQAAAKSANPVFVKQVDDFQKKRFADADLRERIAKFKAKLKEMPNDPEANFGYGMILCSQENWSDGLAMLAKAADKNLADLAKRDKMGAKEVKAKRELGDEWWNLAKASDEGKNVFLSRAKFWYDQIKGELTGQDKLDLASRINQIDETLAKSKKPDSAPVAVGPKPGPKSEFVVRQNFNTVQNEATFKNEWKTEGEWRVESGGIRLASGKGEITSAFQLIDNWKLVIDLTPETREVQVEVNQESFILVANSSAARITVERKGKKLGYTMEQGGRIRTSNVIMLKDDRIGPSTMVVRTEKAARDMTKSDGTLLQKIMLTGRVKMGGE